MADMRDWSEMMLDRLDQLDRSMTEVLIPLNLSY